MRPRRRRTEEVCIAFASPATGWAFDVTDNFKAQLDIRYTRRVDKDKNAQKSQGLGRKLGMHEKAYKSVWTQEVPPAYSFAEGHVFYDPPGVRAMAWADALKIVRRRVQVMGPEKRGRVVFEISYYLEGRCSRCETMELLQQEFAEFLKTGRFSGRSQS